jgi:hypothetical protein
MPFAFAVVCEAEADYRTATGLAERVLLEHVDYLEPEILPACLAWRGLEEVSRFLRWRDVKQLAQQYGIRAHGHFGDQPAEPDAQAARRALLLLRATNRSPDGVLLIRDDDREKERRKGLEQAREESPLRDRIVIGLAHCKRECWVLAGFDPLDPEEASRLGALRAELGFDPRIAAHELTAKHDADKRSAKRVLCTLTQDSDEREAHCWVRTHLQTLRDRGGETGLTEYLDNILVRLVPVFTGTPGP